MPSPVRPEAFIGAVDMLIQMDQKRSRKVIPKRDKEDQQVILRAKELIMEKNDMTEDQAYRYIQRKSMETSSKMTEISKLILAAFD
jgi:response regulator NasT